MSSEANAMDVLWDRPKCDRSRSLLCQLDQNRGSFDRSIQLRLHDLCFRCFRCCQKELLDFSRCIFVENCELQVGSLTLGVEIIVLPHLCIPFQCYVHDNPWRTCHLCQGCEGRTWISWWNGNLVRIIGRLCNGRRNVQGVVSVSCFCCFVLCNFRTCFVDSFLIISDLHLKDILASFDRLLISILAILWRRFLGCWRLEDLHGRFRPPSNTQQLGRHFAPLAIIEIRQIEEFLDHLRATATQKLTGCRSLCRCKAGAEEKFLAPLRGVTTRDMMPS